MTPCTSTSTETATRSSPQMLIGKEKALVFTQSFHLHFDVPMYAQFADAKIPTQLTKNCMFY
jgi:hypothetical protein